MKKLTVVLLLFISLKSFSQNSFYRIGIGFSGGLTGAYTDLTYGGMSPVIPGFEPKKTLIKNKSYVIGASADYYFSPFITGGLEYNQVQLKDGTDLHNRAFVADFSAIEVRGNVAAGQFIDYSYSPFLYAIRNVNAGIGIGFISGKNNVLPYDATKAPTDYPFPRRMHANDRGKSKYSSVISLPISIGYDLNIYNAYQEVKFVVGFKYKMVFTTSDDINGFNDDPSKGFENKSNDAYTSLGISVKYLFGPTGLFFK